MCPIKPLEIDCKERSGSTVLTLGGHISTMEAQVVSETLERLLAERIKRIVVDMAGVELITSDGLGALIRARKSSGELGGTVVLCGLHGNILDVFRMTRLDKIFSLYDSVDTAVAALSK